MKKLLPILFALLLSGSVYAQWSDNAKVNMPVLNNGGKNIYDWVMKTLPNGNTYLVYQQPEKAGSHYTYFQIYDKDGIPIFDNALLISNKTTRSWTATNELLFIDKDRNAIIMVSDCRNDNSGNEYKNVSYTIYKISPDGEFLWTEEGLDIEKGKTTYLQSRINTIQLEDGSYIVSWMDIPTDKAISQVHLQRVSADGNLLWTDKQINGDGQEVSYPYLVNAGDNQFYIAYTKGSNQDIYLRKMDFDGESVWPEDTRVYRGGFGTVPLWTFLEVIPGPDKGVLFAWHDDRSFTNVESVYASYIKADGSFGFSSGEEGQKLGFSGLRGFSPKLVLDAQKKTINAIWRETTATQGEQVLKAQSLSYTGELLWDSEAVDVYPIGKKSLGYYSVQIDDKNNIAAFWMCQDSGKGYGYVEAYAKSLNSQAKEQWAVTFSSIISEKASLQTGIFSQGQWIAIWDDERANSKKSILYGQNINQDGSLGKVVSIEKQTFASQDQTILQSYPNPMRDQARFLLQQEESGSANLKIYDIRGACVATIFEGFLPKGEHELNWNSGHLSNGLYTAILQQKRAVQSIKVIISK